MNSNRKHLMQIGPSLKISEKIHSEKYRGKGETFREAMSRVASTLADNEDHFHDFRDCLLEMRFMPAGRIQAAIGSPRRITPYNCFVSGTIEDSLVDGTGSIMSRLTEAVTTMRMGGGIGYDFSTLRPRGAQIKKLHSKSSGPISFMTIYDAACRCISSAGHRRGAQMGVMRVDHPDIAEFVNAKQNKTELTGFNISVGITDEFMEAVMADGEFDLRWRGEVYDTIQATDLFNKIMRSTWDWAEPGVLFIDRINEENNLKYCEVIAATNPCAEQPLPPFGACLLGSFNLVRYLKLTEKGYDFDFDKFRKDIPDVVRAMDNVVDKAVYPLYEQEKEAQSKRRMGLGITGLANCLELMGHPYGSDSFVAKMGGILQVLADTCYEASALLAKEKGAFPLFDANQYLQSRFVQRALAPRVRQLIATHGIRNSHLISIAPTGTISLCADNISSGIEPVFTYEYQRTVVEFEEPVDYDVQDWAYANHDLKGKTASEVTVKEHMAVLAEAYKWVDSAVSKTLNVPSNTPWEDFKQIYIDAWQTGCKGCTTYQVGGKRGAVLKEKTEEGKEEIKLEQSLERAARIVSEANSSEAVACSFDPISGRKTCDE